MYPLSVVLIKCSILSLLYRIFHVPRLKIYAATIGVSVIFWGITTLVVIIFNCNPINAYWDTQITNKACVNTLHYFLGIQIPNIILDVVIMILPLPYLWRSHITLSSHKAGLLFVFILGGFVIIAATLRLNTIAVHKHSVDFTYDLIDLSVWTALETSTGVLCACFAAMQPLLDFAIFGILDTERSTPSTAGRVARPSPEPESTDRQNRWSLKQWPRHNTAPPAQENAGLRPFRDIIRRGRHTASSSWGFNQPLPPDFQDESLPSTQPTETLRHLLRKGYQTERSSFGANQPIPPDLTDEPMPIRDGRNEEEEGGGGGTRYLRHRARDGNTNATKEQAGRRVPLQRLQRRGQHRARGALPPDEEEDGERGLAHDGGTTHLDLKPVPGFRCGVGCLSVFLSIYLSICLL
ncbi:hypothetical protein HO173_012934 [Letharia columbiana]|uniref:Rhodopsin domain-containing protein n=1 Tax=Letharia columbiana TaxID=112416 RepID=A0A8H6CJX6_9LECA|nr:uncharacterized protein HO173_012934 [Letharia columbiana]KAF6224591.1 hypothetical protein HO173_012934 [Letharia columbiana]